MATPETVRIREFIENRLLELGASPAASSRETLLMRNGTYCGQRFQCDGYQAVWFVEEDQIKFHAADGSLLAATRPSEIPQSDQKIAA